MELVGDSLRRPRTHAWNCRQRFVTVLSILSLGPLLQYLEETADILHRLLGILFGNHPAGSAFEYRDGLFNEFRAILRHSCTPNKKTPQRLAR